jgi:hypothetical protein
MKDSKCKLDSIQSIFRAYYFMKKRYYNTSVHVCIALSVEALIFLQNHIIKFDDTRQRLYVFVKRSFKQKNDDDVNNALGIVR